MHLFWKTLFGDKHLREKTSLQSFQVSRFGGRSPDFWYSKYNLPISRSPDLEWKSPDLLQETLG